MKVGFTSVRGNIYQLKKESNLGFGNTQKVQNQTSQLQNNVNEDEEKLKRKKIIAGSVAAVTIPATIGIIAMIVAKNKKIASTKSISKIEKELTKNDLLKNTQEVQKILRALTNDKFSMDYKSAQKLQKTLQNYSLMIKKMFGQKISSNVLQNIDNILKDISKYLSDTKNKNQSFVSNKEFNNNITNLGNNIAIFSEIISKHRDISSIRKALESMFSNKPKVKPKVEIADDKQKIDLDNGFIQASKSVINKDTNTFSYDMSGKNLNDVHFAKDKDNNTYLILNKTSNIAPKNVSGFKVPGMGDERFVALKLDDLNITDITNLIKNDNIKNQLVMEDSSNEAKTFIQSVLDRTNSNGAVVSFVDTSNVESDNELIKGYVSKKITKIPTASSQQAYGYINSLTNDTDSKLSLLVRSKDVFQERMDGIVEYLQTNPSVSSKDKNPFNEFINLTKKIKGINKGNLNNVINECDNFISLRNLINSTPGELMKNYSELIEINKDNVEQLKPGESLFILNNGKFEIRNSIDDNKIFNLAYQIELIKNEEGKDQFVVKNAKDREISYIQDGFASETGKLKFNMIYNDAVELLYDMYSMKDMGFDKDQTLMKPLLYSVKDTTNLLINKYKKDSIQLEEDRRISQGTPVRTKSEKDMTEYADNVLSAVDKNDDCVNALKNINKINGIIDTLLNGKGKVLETKISEIKNIVSSMPLISLENSYNAQAFNDLLDDKNILKENGDNLEACFMDKYVANKFGKSKEVYKKLIAIDGSELGEFKVDIKDDNSYETKYTLKDNESYSFVRNKSKFDIEIVKQGKSPVNKSFSFDNYDISNIEKNKELETLLFYTMNKKEQKGYLQSKIKNIIEKNDNWAEGVQNIIHVMYSANLLDDDSSSSLTTGNKKTVKTVYENYLKNGISEILYIDPKTGEMSVSSTSKTGLCQLVLG